VAETKPLPPGISVLEVTSFAVIGPLFVTVSVYVTLTVASRVGRIGLRTARSAADASTAANASTRPQP
jgi:hypothetical protein